MKRLAAAVITLVLALPQAVRGMDDGYYYYPTPTPTAKPTPQSSSVPTAHPTPHETPHETPHSTPHATPTPKLKLKTIFKQKAALTPGAALAAGPAEICAAGYARSVPKVTKTTALDVFTRYGITNHPAGAYQIDHLIPIGLGGSGDITNLFPQSNRGTWNAHLKDRLESKLHRLVCSGKLDLPTAQQAIAKNWVAAFRKYLGKKQR